MVTVDAVTLLLLPIVILYAVLMAFRLLALMIRLAVGLIEGTDNS
jgi:hypothetical protein